MGWVQEIADIVGKLSFYDIVHEYEQGLYFRSGTAIDRRIRWSGEELEEIVKEEEKIIETNAGKLSIIANHYIPFRKKPEFPQDYRTGFFTGLPKHKKRFEKSKILKSGIYFNIPIKDSIRIDSQQEKVINLGNICVPTVEETDSKVVLVSCNIRYQVILI